MDEALSWRTKAFLGLGTLCLLLVLSADSVASMIGEDADPDALTIGAWLFLAIDSAFLTIWLFSKGQIAKMHERMTDRQGSVSLGDVGKTLSFLAASLASTPVLMGLVLLSISGDSWRLYVFVPISVLMGSVLWRRIESALDFLARHPSPTGRNGA